MSPRSSGSLFSFPEVAGERSPTPVAGFPGLYAAPPWSLLQPSPAGRARRTGGS